MSARLGAAAWLDALSTRRPLLLAPGAQNGWFGGRALLAFDPVAEGVLDGNGDEALNEAGTVLERALSADAPTIAVALLPYSGDARWAVYQRGFERVGERWLAWGARSDAGWPEPPAFVETGASPATTRLATATSTGLSEGAFCSAVEAVREAILDGDVYVLNLTRTVRARTSLTAAELFSALCDRAPARMAAAWLPAEAPAILSASPERFVRMRGREIEIAPVKGTRPRGGSPTEDAAFAEQLVACEKERAEHVMVVDLERNDLGRVCVPGSIRVDPLRAVETIGYCHQMVSSVRGVLRPDASVGDVLRATFPCGSVTGAPKIAAMRIAEQLESGARGIYTGALVVAMPGELDASVLIRTAHLDDAEVTYGTGCGITVDSDPTLEWNESVLKTQPLLA